MDVRLVIGANVREARIGAGLTQEQLAERSGFSQQYLSDLERGKRNPTVISLYELAQAMGVTFNSIVWAGEAAPAPTRQTKARSKGA